jgi:hypothetical protein
MWKLGGIRNNADAKGMSNILLSCPATRKFRKQFLRKKWMNTNEDVAYKNILSSIN